MKKNIFIVLIFTFFISSCHKDASVELYNCQPYWNDQSSQHPKAQQLQEILDRYILDGYPGLSLAVHTPEGIWTGTAGMAQIEGNEELLPCHLFHSGSVAKTYHVVAALFLAEEGLLDLDATIDPYLPEWVCEDLPNRNTATVRQLMNHTSGIPDVIDDMGHLTDYYNNLMNEFTTEEYLNYICGENANFTAGTDQLYSNTNTILLALIMDEIVGNHADVITEKIIEPLGLQNTFYKNETGYPAPEGLVNTYIDMRGDGTLVNSSEMERNFADMSIGHDGLIASAYDYMQFMHALFNGQLVSELSLEQMMEVPNVGNFRGLGLDVIHYVDIGTLTGHNGGSLGAANMVVHFVEKNITICLCSNFGGYVSTPLGDLFYFIGVGYPGTLMGDIERLLLE